MKRIPLYQSDYPKSFNKIAKYFGRHWPRGELGLNRSRETAAILLGYSNIYSLEKEFVTSSERLSTEDAIKVITAKGVKHYSIDVKTMHALATKAPLHELNAVDHNSHKDAARQLLLANQLSYKSKYPQMVMIDEAGMYGPKQTDIQTHRNAITQMENVPQYSYTVYQDGRIFSADAFAALLNLIDADSFEDPEIIKSLVSQATMSIKEYIESNEKAHRLPRWIELRDVLYGPDEFLCSRVFHNGLKAFYPVHPFDALDIQEQVGDSSIGYKGFTEMMEKIFRSEIIKKETLDLEGHGKDYIPFEYQIGQKRQMFLRPADYFDLDIPEWFDELFFPDGIKDMRSSSIIKDVSKVVDIDTLVKILGYKASIDSIASVMHSNKMDTDPLDSDSLRAFFHTLYDPASQQCNPTYTLDEDDDEDDEDDEDDIQKLGEVIRVHYPLLRDYSSAWIGEMFSSFYHGHMGISLFQDGIESVNSFYEDFYPYIVREVVHEAFNIGNRMLFVMLEKIGIGEPITAETFDQVSTIIRRINNLHSELLEISSFIGIDESRRDMSYLSHGQRLNEYDRSFFEFGMSMGRKTNSIHVVPQRFFEI